MAKSRQPTKKVSADKSLTRNEKQARTEARKERNRKANEERYLANIKHAVTPDKRLVKAKLIPWDVAKQKRKQARYQGWLNVTEKRKLDRNQGLTVVKQVRDEYK